MTAVALRKESVDRNTNFRPESLFDLVALRKESVDRNMPRQNLINGISLSLSARRAWIEMPCAATLGLWACPSLSARRAWIEMADPLLD